MTDKAFNEQPMIVVVSDALDPRIKRQLQSQLQATTYSISQVDAEVKNAESMKVVKQQLDSAKDASEFDESEVKEEATPQAIENAPAAEGDEPPAEEATPPEEGEGEPAKEEDDSDPFKDDEEGNDSTEQAKNKPEPAKEEPPKEAPVASNQTEDDSDPFADDTPSFESFGSIFGINFKKEDADEGPVLPPMKQVLVIKGTDAGVDSRTASAIAAVVDPENTVAIVDTDAVVEIDAKLEFESAKKQMQQRGITVLDNVGQAIDFLNDVYEQIAAK